MSFKLTDFITVSNTGITTFGSDGILINRTSADAYLFFQKSGTNRGAIYGGDASDGNGLRFFIGNNSDPSLSIVSNGQVGIGGTPSYTLHVSGNIIAVEDSAPALRLIGGTTSFDLKSDGGVFKVRDVSGGNELYHIAAGGSGYHKWYINDSLKMTLDSSGNVGIGVTPYTQNLIAGSLDLNGGAGVLGYDKRAYLTSNIVYNSGWKVKEAGYGAFILLGLSDGSFGFYNTTQGASAGDAVTETARLTISSGGDATFSGKSDITTSVSGFASTITNNKDDSQGLLVRTSDNDGGEYILDLQSSSSATGTNYASKFKVAKGGAATFSGNVEIDTNGGDGALGGTLKLSSTNTNVSARNWALINTWDNYGDLTFRVGNAQGDNPLTSGSTKMVITSGGNVGIGTTSPGASKLTISDGVAGYSTANVLLQVKRNATNSNDDTSRSAIMLANNSNAFTIAYGGTTDRLRFINGSGNEQLTLLNGGNLGIGTTAPVKTLDVQGQLAISNNASSYWYLDRNDSSGNFDIINDSNQVKLSISQGGETTITASYSGGTFPFRVGYLDGSSTYTPTFSIDDNGETTIMATSTSGLILAQTGQSYYHKIRNQGDGLYIGVDDGGQGGAGADLRIAIKGSEKMRITSGGDVAIGSSASKGFLNSNGTAFEFDVNRNPNTGVFGDTNKSHARIEMNGASGGSSILFKTASANNTTATTKLTISSGGAATFFGGFTYNENSSQAGFICKYTGATPLDVSISTYNNTFNIYNETNNVSILNYNQTTNAIAAPTGNLFCSNGNIIGGSASDLTGTHYFNKGASVNGGILYAGSSTTGRFSLVVQASDTAYNNSPATCLKVGGTSSTSRSISAAGTVNASGADYAEYMTKAVTDTIGKGDIVGVNSDGLLTTAFDDSISFVIKSTNPSLVGNDTWGIESEDEDDIEEARIKVDRIAFSWSSSL